jgi:hypothetical protein
MKKQLLKQIKEFEKGDYIKITWYDANDLKGPLVELKKPEILVDEWGVFLGIEGSPKHILLGKAYILKDRIWEASCIPLTLIHSVELVAKHVSRTFFLRKYRLDACRNVVRVKDFG